MNRSKRVVEQLGMSHGAAVGQLKKRILFNLLKRLKENFCFKCGECIDLVGDLSIEHKQPWENISADLFWDLDNIAFSHLGCNRPHFRHGGEGKRKIGPEGTSWCTGCQIFEPIENFWKDKSNWSGLSGFCKKTKHYYREKDLSACGEKANAEDLKPSA
jgi:hypothetical protein